MAVFYSDSQIAAAIEAVRSACGLDDRTKLRYLGEGFNNLALETDGGSVLMVGKNDNAAFARAFQTRLLPALAPVVTAPVPVPDWWVESGPGLPFGAMSYRKLPGERPAAVPPPAPPIARDIGFFLASLHSYPAAAALSVGLPGLMDFLADLAGLRDTIDPFVCSNLTPQEKDCMDAWLDAFPVRAQTLPRPVLIHGDWADNFLVQDGRLSGVIDFEDATVGDSAHDFATLRHYGEPFMRACLDAYQDAGGEVDACFPQRIHLYWQLRSASLFSLRASLREGDVIIQQSALSDLRQSGLLQGPAPASA